MFCFYFSEHYSMSNILPKSSSKVSNTHKLIISKKFDNFAKITLRVTETGPSGIKVIVKIEARLLLTTCRVRFRVRISLIVFILNMYYNYYLKDLKKLSLV